MQLIKLICLATLTMFLCADLSAQEEKGQRKKRGGQQRGNIMQMIQRLDANGDNQLTADEIPERMAQRMARLDLDENGTIDAEEIKQVVERMRARRNGKGEGKGQGKRRRARDGEKPEGKAKGNKADTEEGQVKRKRKGKQGDGQGMTDAPSPEQFIAGLTRRLDKNDDQVISKDEAPERMQKNWDRIDQNGNDQLDEDELKQLAAMMQRRGGKGKAKRNRKGRDEAGKKPGGGVKPKKPGGSDGK